MAAIRLLLAVVPAVLAVWCAPLADADDPGCAFTHTCSWSPRYDGPMPNVSNVPGTYGGWTTNRVVCSPVTLQCQQVVP